jgi:drug/metabolite transporter (DMT)-like permease
VIASGLGFFLWNFGASRVTTATLAAANNLLVPLAVLIALLFGKDQPDWVLFLPGALCIGAALVLSPRKN